MIDMQKLRTLMKKSATSSNKELKYKKKWRLNKQRRGRRSHLKNDLNARKVIERNLARCPTLGHMEKGVRVTVAMMKTARIHKDQEATIARVMKVICVRRGAVTKKQMIRRRIRAATKREK